MNLHCGNNFFLAQIFSTIVMRTWIEDMRVYQKGIHRIHELYDPKGIKEVRHSLSLIIINNLLTSHKSIVNSIIYCF